MADTLPALNPTFNDDTPFPSIPAIRSVDIRTRVFTHRSLHGRLNHGIFEDHSGDPSPDNEQYEFLGDTVLGLVVTGLLLKMYPNLHVGSYSKIRALIVGNSTLATISCRYNLPAQLKLHRSQEITVRASPNIQADVFESYVGGLYLDQGLPAVEEWLKALFKPYITEAYIHVRAQHGLPLPTISVSPSPAPAPSTGYLGFFNEQLRKKNREGKFHDDHAMERNSLVWSARVEIDGEVLGRGKGSTKKIARNEAAKEALIRMGIHIPV